MRQTVLASTQERGILIKASFHQLIGDSMYPISEMIPPETRSLYLVGMKLIASSILPSLDDGYGKDGHDEVIYHSTISVLVCVGCRNISCFQTMTAIN